MRVLLISDIHANLVALDKVLASAGAYDALWCLGDVVGYGPAPNACVEIMRARAAVCLAGNHDWAVLGKLNLDEFNAHAQHALRWTRAALTAENHAWLAARPAQLHLPEQALTLVHASPRQPIWEYILSPALAAENMAHFNTPICFFGHTHTPVVYHQPPGQMRILARRLPEQKAFLLQEKMLLNPGSVGQPRDGDRRAAYALLETKTRLLTHHRVEYDIAATQAAMAQAQLPRRLIERLSYGS